MLYRLFEHIPQIFFTPIPRSYTSGPLDGVARIFMDTQDHAIYHVWIHLFPTSYARGEKPFGLELESTQVLLLHK